MVIKPQDLVVLFVSLFTRSIACKITRLTHTHTQHLLALFLSLLAAKPDYKHFNILEPKNQANYMWLRKAGRQISELKSWKSSQILGLFLFSHFVFWPAVITVVLLALRVWTVCLEIVFLISTPTWSFVRGAEEVGAINSWLDVGVGAGDDNGWTAWNMLTHSCQYLLAFICTLIKIVQTFFFIFFFLIWNWRLHFRSRFLCAQSLRKAREKYWLGYGYID